MKLFLASIGVLLLTGCNPAYTNPDTVNIAKVRFYIPEVGPDIHSVGTYVFSDDHCNNGKKVWQIGGPIQLGGMSKQAIDVGMWKFPTRSYEDNKYAEILVEADQRLNFALHGVYLGAECNLTMSFLPKAQHQYEVTYLTNAGKCYANIYELVKDGDVLTEIKEPTGHKNAQTCTFFWN